MATRVGFGFAKPNSPLPVYRNHRRGRPSKVGDVADLIEEIVQEHGGIINRRSLKREVQSQITVSDPTYRKALNIADVTIQGRNVRTKIRGFFY